MNRYLFILLLGFANLVSISQVADSFSDGDFTANPTWTVNSASDFTVASGQLKSANTTTNSNFYISTTNTLATNCQWEFYTNLQFNTSSANYVDIYLLSDQANLLSASINGYFVRIGGTLDEICLFKRNGTLGTAVKIIDGLDGTTNVSNNILKIKVTRSSANLFTLERDLTGTGSSYTAEGTITDATFSSTTAFGFFIQQSTASFTQKHIFDDVVVGPIIVDVTPPSISSTTVISNTQLDILFSEPVELTTSQTLTNYNANNSLGNPTSAVRDGSNLALVHLTFASTFSNSVVNTLTVTNVQDNATNAITTATASFTYVAAITLGYKDIIINEIMAAPSTTLNAYRMEYVELYNRSTNSIDLSGLKLADTYTGSGATLGSYILQPNSYVAICTTNSATALSAASGNTNVIGVTSFPSLSNAGDNIYLKSGSTLIDSVNYLDTWYQNSTKKNGGWSLELINPNQNSNCSQASNWIASNDPNGGTPGYINSVYSTAPDLVGPSIASVIATDSLHITICFNDMIAASQLTNTLNYSINGIGSPTLAITSSGNTCAVLSLSSQLTNLTNYTISVSGITDCNGNAVSTPTANFLYFISGTPNFKDIVINEIYADPSPVVHLTTVEFIELYNRSSNPFDLNGMKFTNGSTTATLGSYVLLPSQYVVVCPIADTTQFTALGITNKIGVSSFPGLTNSGDDLFLKTSGGSFIDSVRYSDTWYRNTLKNDGGWTLEQINPNFSVTCLPANNWIASNDTMGGTPGKINSVYSIAPDLIGPKISDVIVIDSMHITVCFNDVISASQLTNFSNYIISDTLGTITNVSAASAQPGNICVDLTLSSKLTNPNSYTVTVSGITDCNANNLSPNTGYFSRYTAKPFDVVINELMPDPDPAINLPNEEFVELKNRTKYYINLKDWSFATLTSSKKLPNMTIAPNGYIVLAGSDTYNLFYNNNGVVVNEVAGFPSLLNYGTTISLRDTTNIVISSVSYETSWYNDASKQDGGWSLEQIDANNPCGRQNNWHASNDVEGGTPGRANSVAASNPDNTKPLIDRVVVISADTIAVLFNEPLDSLTLINPANYSFDNGLTSPTYVKPIATEFKKVILKLSAPMQLGIMYHCTISSGITDCVGNPLISGTVPFALPDSAIYNDVVINEVLFDPNTGGVDFVELYNRSTKTIDLKNLRIGSMDTLSGVLKDTEIINEEGYLLFPETYLVISENGKAVKQQYATPNPQGFLDIVDLPSMNTDNDVVTLSTAGGTVIDNLKYTSKMHFPLLVSTKGVSLERIDFNRSTDDRTNWNSAAEAVGFATPAYRNSQYLQADGGSGWVVSNPLFSPDNDGYNDVLNISYKLDEPGKAANVFIYDSKGRLIRHLVRNEQLATDGVISWNGINDDNEKASIGIYVIYIEAFNLSGKVNKYKLSCTLAGKLN